MKKILLFIFLTSTIFIYSQTKKYVFMVFQVNERVSYGKGVLEDYKTLQKVTDISEIKNFNKDIQAMYEDKVINHYLDTVWLSGKVLSKKTYIFKSYYEASQKRNSFLIGE